MCTIVSMSSTEKSKERFCRTCCVKSCGSMLLDCTSVRLSKFPGPRHSPDRYPTDTQKLTFGSPGTPIPIQSLVKQMKWYENFMHKQRHGLVSHCALLIYNIYKWIFAVSTGSGCSTSTKPLQKNPLPNHSERCTSFLQRNNQPTSTPRLKPKPTSKSHCMVHQTM